MITPSGEPLLGEPEAFVTAMAASVWSSGSEGTALSRADAL
jgi:hypothetical protein